MLQYGFNNSWVSQSMLYVYLMYCSMEDAKQCLWLRLRVYTGSKYV